MLPIRFHRSIARLLVAPALCAAGAGIMVGAGCSQPRSEFHIVDWRGVGQREHFHETYDECFYSASRNGRVDIVARRKDPGPDGAAITQIMHLRTRFPTIPGTTPAESSMINATVHFAIIDGHGGVCYEGAGFVSTHEDAQRGALAGALERAELAENRRVGHGGELFQRARVTGTFHAQRSPRKVVALLNEMDRLFGPQPDYRPRPQADEPL